MNSTKTQILDAAQELIQTVGLNAMSYADISKAVNIRKASIHHHLETSESAEVKLRRYCGLFEATLSSGQQDKACLCGMLGAELKTLESPLTEQVSQFFQDNKLRLVKLLKQGQETGEFQFPGQVEAMADLIFSSLEGGLMIARADGGIGRFRSLLEQLIQIVKG